MQDRLPPETLKQMKNMLAVTLQVTVAQLGPIPDAVGDDVKRMIGEDDDAAILALGCYLEEAQKANSYEILVKGVAMIKEAQKRHAKSVDDVQGEAAGTGVDV